MQTLEVPIPGVFPSATKARPPRKERHRPGPMDRKVASKNSHNISKKTFETTLSNEIKNHNFATDEFCWIDGKVFALTVTKEFQKPKI